MENIIVVAVKGIILHNNKGLIIQRSADDEMGANTWEFVGRKIDFGEGLEDALIREVKEEVNLTITVDRLLYATSFKTDKHRQVVILTYLCAAHDDTVVLSNEHKNYLWANKEQMMSLLSKPIVDNLNQNSVWEDLFAE